MRSTVFVVLVFGIAASPAWALPGGHGNGGGNKPSFATLRVVNDCEHAVDFSLDGAPQPTLAPLEVRSLGFSVSGSKSDMTVTASLVDYPAASDSESAALQTGKTTTATITCTTDGSPTLSIAVSRPGQKVALRAGRESSVMLASTGGLLPLLLIGYMLGRAPRLRESRDEERSISNHAGDSQRI